MDMDNLRNDPNKSIGIGLVLGIGVGIALGNIAIGIAMGMTFGVAFRQAAIKRKEAASKEGYEPLSGSYIKRISVSLD